MPLRVVDHNIFRGEMVKSQKSMNCHRKDAATVYMNTCTPGFHTVGWRKFSASIQFLNFENRTIIKGDMAKNVSEDKF